MMEELECKEEVQKLIYHGFGELCRALDDPELYTSGGRLKKTSLMKKLGLKQKELDILLEDAKRVLETNFYENL